MIYNSFSLNGAWEMDYSDTPYTGKVNPFSQIESEIDAAGTEPDSMDSALVENAVPGYWEDMTEAFLNTPFFFKLRINPEYGIQQYPIAGSAPDMALPNIAGNFFYRRSFNWVTSDSPAVIYFEGVQNTASVWLNNTYLGRHEGYSAPFEFAIPAGVLKEGENTVVISVSNFRLEGYEGEPVSGLTSRAANEYTGGITGDVELRVYSSPLREAAILISEDCRRADIKIESVSQCDIEWKVLDGDSVVKDGSACGDFSFGTDGMERWSPENPKLYTLEITCGEASLIRSFGIRRLIADDAKLFLNGKPYFLRGVCEHCYFPETIHPAHDIKYYRSIIRELKKLGFNFMRFHTYIPEEEYMQAADELGMLLHVESPNNTTLEEWRDIVKFCRRHTSVVIYCCGNELLMDDPFIEHLSKCADAVHGATDALFAPMSAMRGLEYFWTEPDQESRTVQEPFKHHPRRFGRVGEFSDLYASYPNGVHSYFSLSGEPEEYDDRHKVYNKPRTSHEICIDGTYTDLSLKNRYKGLRVGKTDMFDSIERHLESKGLLKKAPLYFKNSCQWQRRIRKFCFEKLRRSNCVAGYDFLGPIDTHWHTFGYDVGMMNEFYELKPGETVRNVLMYNSATVLLNNLGRKTNFTSGEALECNLLVSHYGDSAINDVQVNVRLSVNGKTVHRDYVFLSEVANGTVSELCSVSAVLPRVDKPAAMKLSVTLDGGDVYAENEWELYIFPETEDKDVGDIVVSDGMSAEELCALLEAGRDVVILGDAPFVSLPTSFRIALAGRTSENLATVVNDHPVFENLPHDGFCGWQFSELMEGGKAVCFESDDVAFNPIVEVVSTHKYAIRQASLFEFRALNGRLLVCSMNFSGNDPAVRWLKSRLISYAGSDRFNPGDYISREQLMSLITTGVKKAAANTNLAFNPNDKTAVRRKK